MRRRPGPWLLLLMGLLALGCDADRHSPVSPVPATRSDANYAPETLASELVALCDWAESDQAMGKAGQPPPPAVPVGGLVGSFEREVITGNIAHYSAMLRVGPGRYDQIGIHRVVQESRPNRPIRTRKTLFLLHGDLKDFEGMWMPGQFSPHTPDEFGLAVHLAQNDIDVWGIDQAWNFVPVDETEFAFFADWGIQREVDHLAAGLAVARISRLLTGQGLDSMLLLGYSSGSMTGYAMLNHEAQLPAWKRQVRGFIAADFGPISSEPTFREAWAGWAGYYRSAHEAGQYQDPLIFHDAALLARSDPDGESPFFPGFTNWQCALFLGGGQTVPPTNAHYIAPVLEDGLPVDLQFVTTDQWLDFLENMVPYEPILFEQEYSEALAGMPSPFYDHLGEVTVPVFDLGAAGSFAPYTAATVAALGSSDVTQLYVTTGTPDPLLDYGHIDLFIASNAPELVWEPIVDWVAAHSSPGHKVPDEVSAGRLHPHSASASKGR